MTSMETANPAGIWDHAIKAARSRFATIEAERLRTFIASQPEVVGDVLIREFSALTEGSGMSNGIAFLKAEMDIGHGRHRHDLVLRYAPGVSLLQQKSFTDEFLTMKAVHAAGLPVPRVLWLDHDGSGIGAAGFLMEKVPGEAPASAMYSRGPFADATPEQRHAMMLEPATFHARLRTAALGPQHVPHLVERGNGGSALERELNWWLQEAALITEPDDPRFIRVRQVHDWLVSNQPRNIRPALLIHGDAQHCNSIFRDGKLSAVLDWELSHLGYVETDIVMMVLTTEFLKFTDIAVPGTPTEEDYIAHYEAESGCAVEHWPYFKLTMAFRYLVGQIFAAPHLPNAKEMWEFVDNFVGECHAAARND